MLHQHLHDKHSDCNYDMVDVLVTGYCEDENVDEMKDAPSSSSRKHQQQHHQQHPDERASTALVQRQTLIQSGVEIGKTSVYISLATIAERKRIDEEQAAAKKSNALRRHAFVEMLISCEEKGWKAIQCILR